MPIALQIMEMNKEIRNGEVVKDSAVSAEYDGKIIHIDTLTNDNMAHYAIKDNHLKKLLEMPASKIDLVERLNRYNKRSHNKRTKKHEHSKHQRSKHKGTKHQQSKHKGTKHQRSKNKGTKHQPSKNKPSKNKRSKNKK